MYIKWNNITTTWKIIKCVLEKKLTMLVKHELMYKILKKNYSRADIRLMDKPLRNIKNDVAIYRINTISKNDLKRVERMVKLKWVKLYYNTA